MAKRPPQRTTAWKIAAPENPCWRASYRRTSHIGRSLNDAFTVPANLAQPPAVSVPAGLFEDGLPLGLQVIGRAFAEVAMLRAWLPSSLTADAF
jgi:Asp-tRNA(Asn)/Glu-tRNA(Gln) amidotransferase A subunit family amidase